MPLIVKWNHRVEERFLYRGVSISLTVRVVSRVQQCAWARHFSNKGAWRFYCYRGTKLPADSGKKRWKWALASISSHVFARELSSLHNFWYGSNFRGFNFRPAVDNRK